MEKNKFRVFTVAIGKNWETDYSVDDALKIMFGRGPESFYYYSHI